MFRLFFAFILITIISTSCSKEEPEFSKVPDNWGYPPGEQGCSDTNARNYNPNVYTTRDDYTCYFNYGGNARVFFYKSLSNQRFRLEVAVCIDGQYLGQLPLNNNAPNPIYCDTNSIKTLNVALSPGTYEFLFTADKDPFASVVTRDIEADKCYKIIWPDDPSSSYPACVK